MTDEGASKNSIMSLTKNFFPPPCGEGLRMEVKTRIEDKLSVMLNEVKYLFWCLKTLYFVQGDKSVSSGYF